MDSMKWIIAGLGLLLAAGAHVATVAHMLGKWRASLDDNNRAVKSLSKAVEKLTGHVTDLGGEIHDLHTATAVGGQAVGELQRRVGRLEEQRA